MQQAGLSSPSCSSTSDHFPLRRLHAADECGSETSDETRKREVRAGFNVTAAEQGSADSGGSSVDEPAHLSRMRSIVSFYASYLLCACLGVACVVCVSVWTDRYRGGFAWDGSGLQFNWHPVLMVTGLIVLYGNGAVLYRVPLTWGHNKLPWKLLHAALMLLALVLSVVGLCAVFGNHNANNIPNLYSLHSWIGIAAAALFAAQWAGGLAVFLLPCSPVPLRKLMKPVHVWFGGSILVLSIVACISGINEKLFFALKGNTNGSQPYSALPPEAVLGNSLGVLIVAFGLVVLKILSSQEWQRPEDMSYAPLLQEETE